MRGILFFSLMITLTACGDPNLRLSSVITDHMVVQRDKDIPIYGTATPGTTVRVRFGDDSATTEATESGTWEVALSPKPAGGPYELIVSAGNETVRIDDVLVGDVWIASGQSNMEWVVSDANDAPAVIRNAKDSEIRHFKVPRSFAYSPEDTLAGGTWEVNSPETVGGFTAVGYFFAKQLREHVGVPIGILHTSWGGSRLEPWMKAEALGMDEAATRRIEEEDRQRSAEIIERLQELTGEVPETDPGLVDGMAVWADPMLDDSDWRMIDVPSAWEQVGYDGMDGVAWYRTNFIISAPELERNVVIGVGMIDDSDITWVNGVEVGRMEWSWNKVRRYSVPASALRSGVNILAVRVEDGGGGGGIVGGPELVYVEVGGVKRRLPSEWRFKVGQISVTADGGKNQIPTLLFNAMVHPLLKTPVKGAIWYQGESNAGSVEDATRYSDLFKTMITSWREDWGQGDFPFLWVQLANYMAVDAVPAETSTWAVLRESQTDALELPATGQAVIIDIGETNDIHPKNKQDVGLRLALAARKVAYGQDVVFSGPTYRSMKVDGNRIVVSFEHVGSGLEGGRGGSVKGFAIAGKDGRFHWAQAVIDGDEVVVSSPSVPRPVSVRYAWANNPLDANLYNNERLPATPFRSDRP